MYFLRKVWQIMVVIKTHELIVSNSQKLFQCRTLLACPRGCKYSEFAFFLQYKVLSSFQLFPTAVFQKVIWWYLELFWIFALNLIQKTWFQSSLTLKKFIDMFLLHSPSKHTYYLRLPVASDDIDNGTWGQRIKQR